MGPPSGLSQSQKGWEARELFLTLPDPGRVGGASLPNRGAVGKRVGTIPNDSRPSWAGLEPGLDQLFRVGSGRGRASQVRSGLVEMSGVQMSLHFGPDVGQVQTRLQALYPKFMIRSYFKIDCLE